MTKKILGLGLVALILAVGMSFVGCGDTAAGAAAGNENAADLIGTWTGANDIFILDNRNWERTDDSGNSMYKGTYTTGKDKDDKDIIIAKKTEIFGDELMTELDAKSIWYTKDTLKILVQGAVQDDSNTNFTAEKYTDAYITKVLNQMFADEEWLYVIDDTATPVTLKLTIDGTDISLDKDDDDETFLKP